MPAGGGVLLSHRYDRTHTKRIMRAIKKHKTGFRFNVKVATNRPPPATLPKPRAANLSQSRAVGQRFILVRAMVGRSAC
jgi:hypothetical protein